MNEQEQTPSGCNVAAIYAAATDQWIHAEQMRWTILYNFLVGNTILLVAWSTLYAAFTSHPTSLGLRIVLIGSCGVGMFGGVVWAFLEHRANRFSERFFKTGFALEQLLSKAEPSTPKTGSAELASGDGRQNTTEIVGPFITTDQHRAQGGPIKTHVIVVAVPIIFSAIYIGLLMVSIYAAMGVW
jgi:hypothetical protein